MSAEHSQNHPREHHGDGGIPVFIDDVKYEVPKETVTGAELRALPNPPLASNVDLWLEVPGPGDDMLIASDETYTIKPGSHFYTAPSTINPGAPHGSA